MIERLGNVKHLCDEFSLIRSIVVIWFKVFQTELMVEIYSKSLVRAIGKVLLIKFSKKTN